MRILSESILKGNRYQTLEGVTGSGKTYTMTKVIENSKFKSEVQFLKI
jgi:excinuclease ABC subunit B